MEEPPPWLVISADPAVPKDIQAVLDRGEATAITLAASLPADLLPMDEGKGRSMAEALGLRVARTINILA